jgi:hypothetical protein
MGGNGEKDKTNAMLDSQYSQQQAEHSDFLKSLAPARDVYTKAATGGNAADIRARGTSVIPSFFDSARREANNQRVVQGGYGPGSSAMFARLSRQQAGAGQEAARNANLDVMDNQMKGAEGLNNLGLQERSIWQSGQGGLINSKFAANQGSDWKKKLAAYGSIAAGVGLAGTGIGAVASPGLISAGASNL